MKIFPISKKIWNIDIYISPSDQRPYNNWFSICLPSRDDLIPCFDATIRIAKRKSLFISIIYWRNK